MSLRVGCSGWNYRSWRGAFYPERLPAARWLEHYARVFDCVEVNTTHYRLAREEVVARWVEQTPEHFLFAVKSSRFLTHMKRLRDVEAGIERFWAPLEPLRASGKLGPVLWQLPPDFRRDDARLAATLELLPPAHHAWEFRHPSWFCDEVAGLLRAHDCAWVLAHDARRPLPAPPPGAPWAFVRFHFGARGRRGNYSDTELRAWAAALAGADGFAFFNNDWEAFAPRNARVFRAAMRAGGTGRRSGSPR